MATDKQIEANRANALKSTGPRTPEGKAISSRNGLRHGLLAKSYLLENECDEGFREFIDTFYAEHRPRTPTQRAIVDQLATARWRQIRLANLEVANVNYELRQIDAPDLPTPMVTALALRQAVSTSGAIALIHRAEGQQQRTFNSAYRQLTAIHEKREENGDLEPPDVKNDDTNPISERPKIAEDPYIPAT